MGADPLIGAGKITPGDIEKIANEAEQTARQRFLAARHGAPSACPACEKLYSGCPLGWSVVDGGLCTAPSAYNGVCSTTQSFVGATLGDLHEAEETCGICWPCVE